MEIPVDEGSDRQPLECKFLGGNSCLSSGLATIGHFKEPTAVTEIPYR